MYTTTPNFIRLQIFRKKIVWTSNLIAWNGNFKQKGWVCNNQFHQETFQPVSPSPYYILAQSGLDFHSQWRTDVENNFWFLWNTSSIFLVEGFVNLLLPNRRFGAIMKRGACWSEISECPDVLPRRQGVTGKTETWKGPQGAPLSLQIHKKSWP